MFNITWYEVLPVLKVALIDRNLLEISRFDLFTREMMHVDQEINLAVLETQTLLEEAIVWVRLR